MENVNVIADQITEAENKLQIAENILHMILSSYGFDETNADELTIAQISTHWKELCNLLYHVDDLLLETSSELGQINA